MVQATGGNSRLGIFWGRIRGGLLAVLAALGILTLTLAPVEAGKAPVFTGLVKGVAVGGYDPVAYFTTNEAVTGKAAITFEYNGATWRFASEDNRAAFAAEPEKYAPQFGGYCAWAVSQGYTAKGDPKAWSIVDGKLYLNYNASVRKNWSKNAKANITRGMSNWPRVLED